MKRILFIDAYAIIYRAFHALPELTAPDGTPTNAIHGFFSMLHKVLQNYQPYGLIVCFDTPTKTFRKELYEGYQAARPSMPENLQIQVPLIRKLLESAEICCLEKPGFEADDVIGTTVTAGRFAKEEKIILTGDKDIFQLVTDSIHVLTPKIGLSNTIMYTPDLVKEKMGVTPTQIPDYKALAGDPSDNYHGVQGLGPKTAIKLISEFDSVESIYKNIDKVQPEKLQIKLRENEEQVRLFKIIATIRTDVDVTIPENIYVPKQFPDTFLHELQKLHQNTMIRNFYPDQATERLPEPPKKTPSKPVTAVATEQEQPNDQFSLLDYDSDRS